MKCPNCQHVIRKTLRSSNQNSYYWGIVIDILCQHTGYTPNEMHEALKAKFLSKLDENTGLMRIKSTTELDTAVMEIYLEEIRRWAARDLECFIPEPNEAHQNI